MQPLRIAIPDGSLKEQTLNLLGRAGWPIKPATDRTYIDLSDDAAFDMRFCRPRVAAELLLAGKIDAAFLGDDVLAEVALERGVAPEIVPGLLQAWPLQYSKSGRGGVRHQLAIPLDAPFRSEGELVSASLETPLAVETEFPQLVERYFNAEYGSDGWNLQLLRAEGKTEAMTGWRCDAVVDVSDSGRTFTVNGLLPVSTLFRSTAVLALQSELRWSSDLRWAGPEIRERAATLKRFVDPVMAAARQSCIAPSEGRCVGVN